MLGAIYISNKMGLSLAKSILGSVAEKKRRRTLQQTLHDKVVFQNHIEDTQYGSKILSYPFFKSCDNVSIANNHPQTTSASLLKTSIQNIVKKSI